MLKTYVTKGFVRGSLYMCDLRFSKGCEEVLSLDISGEDQRQRSNKFWESV